MVTTTQPLSPSVRQSGQMYAPNGVHVGTVYNRPVNDSAQSVVGAYSPYATVLYAPKRFDSLALLDNIMARAYQPNPARQQPVKMPRFGGGGVGVPGGRNRSNGVSRQAQRDFVDLGSWNAYKPGVDMRVPAAPTAPERVTVDLATGAGLDPDGNPIQLTPRAVSPDDAPIQYNGTSDRVYATDEPLGDTMMPPSSAPARTPIEPDFATYGQFPSRWYPNEPVGPVGPVAATPNAAAVQTQVPVAVAPPSVGTTPITAAEAARTVGVAPYDPRSDLGMANIPGIVAASQAEQVAPDPSRNVTQYVGSQDWTNAVNGTVDAFGNWVYDRGKNFADWVAGLWARPNTFDQSYDRPSSQVRPRINRNRVSRSESAAARRDLYNAGRNLRLWD